MALTTYTELQAAIASRLHRSDLTASIVDYITLAEKRINRLINPVALETETTLTATIGIRSLTIPALFNAPIALYLTTWLPRIELEFRLPEEMQVYSSNGPSSVWTIDGTTINTDTPADRAYTYAFRYRADCGLAASSTNTVLTNYPDLYFYGSLVEAADDLRDDNSKARWEGRFQQALEECNNNEHANKSPAKLTTELGTQGRGNIIRGF